MATDAGYSKWGADAVAQKRDGITPCVPASRAFGRTLRSTTGVMVHSSIANCSPMTALPIAIASQRSHARAQADHAAK